LEASRDFPWSSKNFFRGLIALTETVKDKIFLTMSNLYFFNLLRGIQVNFKATFHLALVLDFADMLLVRVVATQHGEYITEKSGLDY
jgi:acyl-CoA thioesterase